MLGLKEYVVKSLDGWIRRKIRVILWKQWKKSKKRRAMLYDYCNSIKHPNPNLISWLCRNGNRYWYVSHKLNIYISIADIRKLGFKELEQSLLKIKESRRYAELFNIRYS